MTEYFTLEEKSGSISDNTIYQPRTIEEDISWFINSIRFRMKHFLSDICNILENDVDYENLKIDFKTINQTIAFKNKETPKRLLDYLESILQNNQIFQDLSFYPGLNTQFNQIVSKTLKCEHSILGNRNTINELRNLVPFNSIIGHFLPLVKKENFAEALSFSLVYQFFNEIEGSSIETNFLNEKEGGNIMETLPLLSNDFPSIFISIGEINSEGVIDFVYLCLLDQVYDDINENQDLFPEKSNPVNKKIKDLKKYNEITKSHIQITKISIYKLVDAMDSNGDQKVTFEDIKSFSHKNFIYLEDSVYQKMYDEAKSYRNYKSFRPVEEPISVEEIHNAVQLKMRKINGKWVESEKPFRELWIKFLDLIGESNYNRQRLPAIKAKPIFANYEKKPFPFHPTLLNPKTNVKIEEFQKKTFTKYFKPEAGLFVVDTPHIIAVNVEGEQPNYNEKRRDPFETVVNARIQDTQGEQKISFNTKQYFTEALKLSKTKEPQHGVKIHPIYSFVPQANQFTPNENKLFRASTMSMISQKTLSLFTSMEEQKTQDELSKSKVEFQPFRQKQFLGSFQPEDCMTLKKKLAKKENHGFYNPPILHKFRDDIPPYNKPEFKIRIKGGIEDIFDRNKKDKSKAYATDFRSQEFLEKEQKLREKELDEWRFRNKPWIKYFRLADIGHNFVTHKYPVFLDKEHYEEPIEMINNLIRQTDDDGIQQKKPFQLFNGTLTTKDKNIFLGEQIAP